MLVYASGQCMEQRSCGCSQLWHSAPPGMAVGCCELRLRSTPRYRLVCICFPTPGRGLPYGSGLGLSRCLGPGECLHSFIQPQSTARCSGHVLQCDLRVKVGPHKHRNSPRRSAPRLTPDAKTMVSYITRKGGTLRCMFIQPGLRQHHYVCTIQHTSNGRVRQLLSYPSVHVPS